jgi:hypothetical protein
MSIDKKKKQRLLDLREKLLDVYLDEADPDNWIDEAKALEIAADLDGKEAAKVAAGWKGERYWEKKNANQTMALLVGIHRFIDLSEGADAEEGDDGKALAKEIRAAEKEVEKRLARTRPHRATVTAITGGKK